MGGERPAKVCAACGRPFAWRRRWARDWDAIRWCSERCRRAAPSGLPDPAEAAIVDLLAARSQGATACPSEVARALDPDAWRDRMDEVRAAAARLVTRGVVEVTQGGRVVQLSAARGPIRLRLVFASAR